MEWATVRVDVLVIGGGGAGSRAALEACAQGASVALIDKQQYGVSGATAFRAAVIGQYQAVGRSKQEGDSFDRHAADIIQAGAGMADERLVRLLVEEAPERITELERWGVVFEQSGSGSGYHIIKGCFASVPRSHVLKDHGYLIASNLERAVRREIGIRVFEHTAVADLLVLDGRCIGALTVDNGNNWTVIEAGATIMAAGGASRIYQNSMYPNGITGDSYSLGFEAGAWLTNMEFVQLGLVTVHPRGGAVNTWTWRMNPRIYNERKEPFLSGYLPEDVTYDEVMALKANHWPFTNSDASAAVEISFQDQILQGNGSPRGGIYVDFTHVGPKEFAALPEAFKPVWTMMADNFRKRRIDLSREPLEAVVGSHSVNGGFCIDTAAATTLSGLYACGECAAGMHGADRLGGNNLPSGQVFGRRAGLYAARYALACGTVGVPHGQVRERLARWTRRDAAAASGTAASPYVSAGKRTVKEAAEEVRQEVSRALCTNRSEEGLSRLLRRLDELHGEAEAGLVSRKGYMALCELHHMIVAAKLIATAARERRETRGPHHRKDYPLKEAEQQSRIFMRRLSEAGDTAGTNGTAGAEIMLQRTEPQQ